jgi:hypothetical protein
LKIVISSYFPTNSSYQTQNNNLNNPKIKEEIIKLQETDARVKTHEMAHKAAGGALAGAPHYTYVTGPDGKKYAVAGEVPIKIEKGKNPQETIKIAEQIKAAALAPADPSPQDLKVAQTAEMIEAKAREELETTKSINLYA